MKNYKIILIPLLFSLFCIEFLHGQKKEFKRVGKSGFSFLKISPSARAAGMGDAFTAIANDVTAIFYNPAGLTQLTGTDFSFGYTNWLVGSKLFSGAIARPIGRQSVIGLSVIQFAPQAFEETTILEPTGTGRMVSVGDISVALAYAVKLTNDLSFGFKSQYIQEWIDTDKASGVAIDFSTHYFTGYRDLSIAMIMKNFGPESKYLTDKFKLPLYFNINSAMSVIGSKTDAFNLMASVESAFATDFRDRYHVGLELNFFNTYSLRSGYKFFYDTEDFTLGAGMKLKVKKNTILIDIAYSNFSEYFAPPLRLSVGGSF